MCGRIGRPDLSWAEIFEALNDFLDGTPVRRADGSTNFAMSWNVKPTQTIDMAFHHENALVSANARWWFVPHWFKGDVKDWKQTTFNARIETACEKPTFRTAWATGRCLVPLAGYYEWTGAKGAKQPHWISAQSNLPSLFFAGLYSRLPSNLYTCTILTRAALPQIAHIHARTPVILTGDDIMPWLTGNMATSEAQTDLGTAWDGRMTHHEVHSFGRDDDGPELIEPIERLL